MNVPLVEELTQLADLREVAELFAIVWERPGEPPISSDILRALSHSGNYIAGVRRHRRLVGGIVGWLGGRPPDHLHMHSHILGVLPGTDVPGLGFAMKEHQRDWCLARGVKVIEWTFDPLVRRNAYFNLVKLGADASRYLVDFYGRMEDGINAGEESDRILVSWQLDSEKAERAARGERREPDVARLEAAGAFRALSASPDDEPLQAEGAARVALCQVPDDIVAIRRRQPELARRWRQALRDTLGAAMEQGGRVEGFTKSGWYVVDLGAH